MVKNKESSTNGHGDDVGITNLYDALEIKKPINKLEIDNPYEAYTAQSNDNLKKFSDVLLSKKGKILELYIGDQSETLNFDDYSVPKNCSIFGKLIEVLDRFVILDCFYMDPITKQLRNDNRVFINTFQIRAMTEVDGIGSLQDVFLSVDDAKRVRNLILKG